METPQNVSRPETGDGYVIYIIVMLLPFIVFYWMTPFLAKRIIGNDYVTYPIQNQTELLFSIKHGSFPLYVPGFAGGNSSSALTVGQIFHPISHIAALLPGYWDGKSLELNTLLRLLSLGLTQLAIFIFIRRLRLRKEIAFILSFITVYNLRMLDLFRYGPSLENYTAYLLLCVSTAWYYIKPSKLWGPIFIIGTTYLLVSGGHPQMMFYGLIGAGLVTLIVPYYFAAILPEPASQVSNAWKFYLQVLVFCAIGILMSSAYTFPFYFDFLSNNIDRAGQEYSWSRGYLDSFFGTMNSFFRPFESDVHGAFGGSSLLIVAAVIPLLLSVKVRIPGIILVVWGSLALVCMYMQGSRLPVHYLAWKYLPFFSTFRIPGRISMMIPFLTLLLLIWLMRSSKGRFRILGRDVIVYPHALLAFLGLVIFICYNLLLSSSLPAVLSTYGVADKPSGHSPISINEIPPWVRTLELGAGALTLIFLGLYGSRQRANLVIGLLICAITFVQTGAVLRYGTWVRDKEDTPTLEQMRAQKKEKLTYWHSPGFGLTDKSVTYHLSQMSLPLDAYWSPDFTLSRTMARLYRTYTIVASNTEAYALLKKRNSADQAIVGEYVPPNDSTIKVQYGKEDEGDKVVLTYSSFNRLSFMVSSHRSAFFVLSFPYSQHWQAFVNSKEARIYRANGIEQAVYIPEGDSQVEFRYWSQAAFWGTLISCLTLLFVLLYLLVNILSGYPRVVAMLAAVILVTSIFGLWYQSLYSGDNLGTKYVWTSKDIVVAQ